ncbi:MAG: hypothetical protein CXX81_14000 [Methanobacteriota archaeon]|nr:MAG: hypothetical protein CXX81_14000 [Euryarchaeota archaeon]
MFDEATLGLLSLLVFSNAFLLKHCREWRVERHSFHQWSEGKLGEFSTVVSDVIEILEDIADATSNPNPSPIAHTGLDVPSLLTNMIMSKMNIGAEHGTLTKDRSLSEEVSDKTPQQIQERLQSQERDSLIHHDERDVEDDNGN